MEFVTVALLFGFVSLAVPALIVFFIIKLVSKNTKPHDSDNHTNIDYLKLIFLVCLMAVAATAGIAGVILIPKAFFGVNEFAGSGTALTVYLLASMFMIIVGILLKELTGKFLMIIGILLLIFSVLPYVAQYKTLGGFFLVLATFIVLVYLVVKSSRKVHNG